MIAMTWQIIILIAFIIVIIRMRAESNRLERERREWRKEDARRYG